MEPKLRWIYVNEVGMQCRQGLSAAAAYKELIPGVVDALDGGRDPRDWMDTREELFRHVHSLLTHVGERLPGFTMANDSKRQT